MRFGYEIFIKRNAVLCDAYYPQSFVVASETFFLDEEEVEATEEEAVETATDYSELISIQQDILATLSAVVKFQVIGILATVLAVGAICTMFIFGFK